jgi:hypothetical protein
MFLSAVCLLCLTSCLSQDPGEDAGAGQPGDGTCQVSAQCTRFETCIDGRCVLMDASTNLPPDKDGGGGGGEDGGCPWCEEDSGVVQNSCEYGTCPGCCTTAGYCEPFGSTDTTCGVNNGPCVNCTESGKICVNHQCQEQGDDCTFGECTGCCDFSNNCQNGLSSTACGNGGATCIDCTISSQTCKSGYCSN